ATPLVENCFAPSRVWGFLRPFNSRGSIWFTTASTSNTMAPPGNHHRYYPEVKSPLRRQVHAPSPVRKFGLSCPRQVVSGNAVGVLLTSDCNSLERKKLDLPLDYRTEVIDVDEVDYVEVISDDDEVDMDMDVVVEEVESEKEVSLDDVNPKNGSFMVVDEEAVTDDVCSFEAYRKALKSAENRTSKLKARGFGDFLRERCRGLLRSLRSFFRQDEEPVQDVRREPFQPLSKEELTAVKDAFSANFQFGLLFTCFFMMFLLFNSATGYNYNAVRRWTSMKKLGYHLIDCDKIFIPIHMNIHWTLAVINIKERKFQYLDSYKGREPRILDALGRYFVDEVRDKNEVDVDVSQWRQEFVQDLPEQSNGFDCGMFMLKYMDFYSRGLDLCFTEEHMAYFRVRTAKEILQLRAE
ncbi:hypothetical protein F2Q69_00039058, partial [Brassica cretica]